MRNCAFSLEPGCCVCWVFGSCALPWEEPVEFVFSVMKNLPAIPRSLLAGKLVALKTFLSPQEVLAVGLQGQ